MSEPMRFRDDKSDLLKKPIVDEDGNNPFADPGGAEIPDDAENIFAVPQDTAYRPHGYVDVLAPRSGLVLGLGLVGLLISFVCLAAFHYLPIVALANLGLTLPAWLKGVSELRAIAAGAVRNSSSRRARAGMIMGVIGTGLSLLAAGSGIYYRLFVQPFGL